ncbi:hypothetical protein ACE1B6_06040 [Aerosakkonemataceae cyanobacterium BLCC-F154]|uniref:Uncharacterized protein n=1 Tax=Floridaenema fluviatile BLCC-F154 TaxID=3153640 RepID=A0ABV4Y7N6_9CYAN
MPYIPANAVNEPFLRLLCVSRNQEMSKRSHLNLLLDEKCDRVSVP